MFEYGKTENLFTRNPDTHKLNMGDFRLPEFDIIKYWHVTEKIDGTNMRVIYNPSTKEVEIRGRSDRAQIHGDLLKYMQEFFTHEKMAYAFDSFLFDRPGSFVTLYGEGYGAGIQNGGGYSPTKRFRIFDIVYSYPDEDIGLKYKHSYCNPSTVEEICKTNDFPMVPMFPNVATIEEIVHIVGYGYKTAIMGSQVAWDENDKTLVIPEGIIARTDPYLFNHRGQRIMFKLKTNDLPNLEGEENNG